MSKRLIPGSDILLLLEDGKLEVGHVTLVDGAIWFTQTDGNEYIDSLNDGYMDYAATTAHRFTGPAVVVRGDLTIGNNIHADPTITADGDHNDGQLLWMEDEDYWQFPDDVRLVGGENLILDTSTGSEVGTAAAQLLGFWGTTPVDQPASIADATGAGDVVAQLNLLLASMREIGLIAPLP